jgi:hypothetical protein
MNIPSVKSQQVFFASDNTQFSNQNDAKIQEVALELRRRLMAKGVQGTAELKAICVELCKNYGQYGDAFDALRRVRRNMSK